MTADEELRACRDQLDELQRELAETNRGVVALSLELEGYRAHLEELVAERTAQLQATQVELQQTNSELLMLTQELDSRIAERTAELERYRSDLEELVAQRTAQLRAATESAKAANAAKSAFLANMSHELRTPMNAILGFADLLRSEATSDDQREEYLEIISRSGIHLLALINDVLDMSKIESGRSEVDLRPMAPQDLAGEVVDLMRERAEAKGLALVLDTASGLPPAVRTDPVKVRQILLNLVSNAIKCTASGEVRLEVSVQAGPKGETLVLQVSDHGRGIAPEDLDRIFQPFQQAGSTGGGTGLGLPISRGYAELLGGRLTVNSELGRGSVFRVELPLESTPEAPVSTLRDDRRVVELAPGTSVRVLVAEDQLENSLLLRTLMEQVGITTAVAADGKAAVEAFLSFRPDLIWMDQRMPVMSGLEATRRIRSLPGGREVVVIGVTASVFEQDRSTLLAGGMDDIITKPYRPQDLYACLEQHLGVRFLHREAGSSAASARRLAPVELARLSPGVRAALSDALVLLDDAAVSAAIDAVAAEDPELGRAVRQLADDLRYEEVLDALDELAADLP